MLTNYQRRQFRVRNKIKQRNDATRPRISVFRSNKNLYAQLIDHTGKVLGSYSTLNLKDAKAKGIEKAAKVGEEFAKLCVKNGAKKVVFDKGAYLYNGRVKALAEACRKSGLEF